jgi:hypothetical protein
MCQAVDGTVPNWVNYQMVEVTRLAQIIASLKEALLHRSFEAGKFLIELEKESKYGEWGTFDNFVESELRIKVRTARRLMVAHQIRELFKENGRLLPVSENSVRPLSEQLREDRQRAKKKLTLDELRIKAWDIACLAKQRSTPTGTDVSRAVRQLMTATPDETMDKAFRAYRRHVNRVRSETARMTKQMPELAGFLECVDKKTRRQRKEMGKMLAKLTMSFDGHRSVFEGDWKPDKKLFKKGEYLAALSKAVRLESEAKRLQRRCVILVVRDFIHRTGSKVPPPKVVHPLPDIAYAESLDIWTKAIGVNPDPKPST